MTTPDNPIRVLVVDDNPIMRSGLVSLLEAGDDVVVVGEAGNGREAIDQAASSRPDLILLDVRMPEMDGVEAAAALGNDYTVVMLTNTEDPDTITKALENGASGYLVHGSFTADDLGKYVHSAASGANPLSPQASAAVLARVRTGRAQTAQDSDGQGGDTRHVAAVEAMLSAREAEVMRLISRGKSNGEIASELFVSEKTVKNHVNRIYAKLGVASRAAAIARWMGTDGVSS